jgi:hypothetical protein
MCTCEYGEKLVFVVVKIYWIVLYVYPWTQRPIVFFKDLFIIFYEYLWACLIIFVLCEWQCLRTQRKGISFPRTGGTGGCELPSEGAEEQIQVFCKCACHCWARSLGPEISFKTLKAWPFPSSPCWVSRRVWCHVTRRRLVYFHLFLFTVAIHLCIFWVLFVCLNRVFL